jgi:hypothetical protein
MDARKPPARWTRNQRARRSIARWCRARRHQHRRLPAGGCICSADESVAPVTNNRRGAATVAFVELPLLLPAARPEWTIEFERASGARMRVRLQGGSASDLVALGRLFWSAEP